MVKQFPIFISILRNHFSEVVVDNEYHFLIICGNEWK
jgi:hypothetical protein